MTQHVAHRHSDEIHELRAEIERLQADNAHLTALLKGLFDYCNDDRRTPKIQSLLEATAAVLALLAEESKP